METLHGSKHMGTTLRSLDMVVCGMFVCTLTATVKNRADLYGDRSQAVSP